MKIKAVVFDMDGLMIDSERVIQRSWGIVGNRLGYSALDQDIYQTLGCNAKKREQYFMETYGSDFPYAQFLKEYRKEYELFMQANGIPVKEGLYELLAYIKACGIIIGVATSSSRQSDEKTLTQIGVMPYVQQLICGDMVREAKPSPEIYQTACARLQVEPSQALALEDSLHGIASAYHAGMQVIMIPDLMRDSSSVDVCLSAKLENLHQVIDWLQHQIKEDERIFP